MLLESMVKSECKLLAGKAGKVTLPVNDTSIPVKGHPQTPRTFSNPKVPLCPHIGGRGPVIGKWSKLKLVRAGKPPCSPQLVGILPA